MRIISAGVAAAFLLASSYGAMAAPAVSTAQGLNTGTALELVAATKTKTTKGAKTSTHHKSSMHRALARRSSMAHRLRGTRIASAARPGECGTMKYYSNGKCVSAANKKSSIGFPGIVNPSQDMR